MGFLTNIIPVLNDTIGSGYYDSIKPKTKHNSLVDAIKSSKTFPIIAEIKPFSPSHGRLIYRDPMQIADEMIKNDVTALSIL
ncbi:hypothetical protein HY570_02355, partial [Candidatus Micrarchaeota archaeon]|nr:hypothetical protein [Candidatus Micrarchaeota archaeon]